MKRKIAVLLVLSMMISVFAFGCGSSDAEQTGGDASGKAVNLNFTTGSTGGTYYALGGAMASVWSANIDGVSVTSRPGGASIEGLNQVVTGEADLCLAMNNIADDAWNGRGSYEGPGAQQGFRTLGVVYPEVYHGVVNKSLGVNTVEGLVGKKVSVGPTGSGSAILTEQIFAEAGLSVKDDIKAQLDGFGDAMNKIKDGHLDASFGVLSVPASAITELEASKAIDFIQIKGELFDKVSAKYPFFSQFVIPAGTYSNTEDVYTVTCQAALYGSAELSEEVAYELTKVMYEEVEQIKNTHAAGKWISLETALDGITTPLHKGAIKFYEEQGIEVPAELKVD